MRTPFTLYAVVRDKPALCRNQRVYTKGVDSSHNKNIAPTHSNRVLSLMTWNAD